MPTASKAIEKLPGRYDRLVEMMPPRALTDDVHYENALEMIDRLMVSGKLTQGQSLYLETLTQLVEVYEAQHHGIETDDLNGIDALRYLLDENDMNASDLARLLGVHASMGSKILQGERSLTVEHVRKLAKKFRVSPNLFIG